MCDRSQTGTVTARRQRRFLPTAFPGGSQCRILEKETAMTAFDHISGSSRFATRPNTVVRLVQVAFNLFKALKNRREFYRLGEMSDAELADIGLTRADLHVAYGHPIGADPTASAERHRAAPRRRSRRPRPAASAEAKPFPQASPLHTGSHRSPADCPVPTDRAFSFCIIPSSTVRPVAAITAGMKCRWSRRTEPRHRPDR